MPERLIAAVTDPTVPPSTEPVASDPPVEGVGSTLSDVISSVFDSLGNNGYQTGVAMIVATVAVVVMLNLKVHLAVLVPVTIGAFWAGWLGWNTFTGQDNALFPGDVSATKLWDVGFTNDMGFLLVMGVACVAAVFLWRTGIAVASRVWLLIGAVLGASFIYNLVEALRDS